MITYAHCALPCGSWTHSEPDDQPKPLGREALARGGQGHQALLRPMRHLSQLVLIDWSRPIWEPLCTWAGTYTMCVCWVYSSFLVRWKTLEGINGFPEATKRMTEHCLCWIHWSFLSTYKKVVLKSFDEQGLIGPWQNFNFFSHSPRVFRP